MSYTFEVNIELIRGLEKKVDFDSLQKSGIKNTYKKKFTNKKDLFNYLNTVIKEVYAVEQLPIFFKDEFKLKLRAYRPFYTLFSPTAKNILYTEIVDGKKEYCNISIKLTQDGQFIKDFWRGDSHSISKLQDELFMRTDIM